MSEQRDDDLMMSGEIARRLGVTSVTINNWKKKGLLKAAGSRQWRGRTFDTYRLADAKEAAGNRNQSGRGGRRRKAGRKPKAKPLAPVFDEAAIRNVDHEQIEDDLAVVNGKIDLGEETEIETVKAAAIRLINAARRLGVLHHTEIAGLSHHQLEVLASYSEKINLTPAQVGVAKDLVSTKLAMLKTQQLEGELVVAAGVHDEFKTMLGRFRKRLDTLADHLTPEIAGEVGATRDQAAAIKGLIERAVTETLEELSTGPMELAK